MLMDIGMSLPKYVPYCRLLRETADGRIPRKLSVEEMEDGWLTLYSLVNGVNVGIADLAPVVGRWMLSANLMEINDFADGRTLHWFLVDNCTEPMYARRLSLHILLDKDGHLLAHCVSTAGDRLENPQFTICKQGEDPKEGVGEAEVMDLIKNMKPDEYFIVSEVGADAPYFQCWCNGPESFDLEFCYAYQVYQFQARLQSKFAVASAFKQALRVGISEIEELFEWKQLTVD